MTQINGTSDVALFIRRQVASIRAAATQGARAAPGGARPLVQGEGKPQATPREDIASLVFRRIRFIDPADPERKRKAFRIFIESVLLFELGDELMNDPLFYQLVDTVQEKMGTDPDLSRSVEEASGMLVSMVESASGL